MSNEEILQTTALTVGIISGILFIGSIIFRKKRRVIKKKIIKKTTRVVSIEKKKIIHKYI